MQPASPQPDADLMKVLSNALEAVELAPADVEMLHDLKDFVFMAGVPRVVGDSLPQPATAPDRAFAVGPFRGVFSLADGPGGGRRRLLTLTADEGVPSPGAAITIARELGFTGARRDGTALTPGKDWTLAVALGEAPTLVVSQPLPRPGRN